MSPEGPSWSSVAVPSEHGGWSLTLEPALLGLIVAPSSAGVLLAASALLAFLLRTPLKLWLGDRRRHRIMARTRMARSATVAYGTALAGLLTSAVAITPHPFWWPPLAALPLFVVELAYDLRSRSRRLVPELAGTIGVGSIAAAIVLADGGPAALATGLWGVAAARAIAAIPYVRVQLRRAKEQPHRVLDSDLSQVASVVVALVTVVWSPLTPVAFGAVAVMAVWHVVTTRRSPPRAPILGAQQVVVGLTVVLLAGLSTIAP